MADLLEIAAKANGDGMPIGNTLTPMIAKTQVTVAPGGVSKVQSRGIGMPPLPGGLDG
jgi:hypothetical protein